MGESLSSQSLGSVLVWEGFGGRWLEVEGKVMACVKRTHRAYFRIQNDTSRA